MKKVILATLFLSSLLISKAQQDTSKWEFSGLASLNFSQVSLSNWNGGGNEAVSLASLVNLQMNRKHLNYTFNNSLTLAYGLQQIDDDVVKKTDDRIEFVSEYSRKAFNKWNYLTNFTFRSQFDKGFTYPTDSTQVLISDFLAPGYFLLSIGLNRTVKENLSLTISPLSAKVTVVNNDTLSAVGAFGVDPGKKVRFEAGASFRAVYKKELVKNVTYNTSLDLFSNYVNNPQNIDVNWSNMLDFKINKFLSCNLSVLMIYDDDIDIAIDSNNDGVFDKEGPRAQWKQTFNLGLQVKF